MNFSRIFKAPLKDRILKKKLSPLLKIFNLKFLKEASFRDLLFEFYSRKISLKGNNVDFLKRISKEFSRHPLMTKNLNLFSEFSRHSLTWIFSLVTCSFLLTRIKLSTFHSLWATFCTIPHLKCSN